MKKNVIAILLAVAMASGTIGTVPVIAAETTEQESVTTEETTEEATTESAETIEDASEGESVESAEEDPDQGSTGSAEESETGTTEETEITEVEEEDSTDIADTSAGMTGAEEPAVAAEGVITEVESKEAKLADAGEVVDSGTCGANLQWTLNNGELIITGTGNMDDYQYNPPWYSLRDQIEATIISEGVTSIGKKAFYECTNLKNVSIPDGVTAIGNYAFKNCSSLDSIDIPNSVTKLAIETFYGCNSLATVNLSENITSIPSSTFQGCSNLSEIYIPSNVESISAHAFEGCYKLSSVTLPESISYLSGFNGCSTLTNINIPDGLETIGWDAFRGCGNLANISIPDSVSRIESCAFYGCESITDIRLPSGLTYLGTDAFHGTSISSIVIPSSLLECGHGSEGVVSGLYDSGPFTGAVRLSKVEFKNGIKSIPSYILTSSGFTPSDNSSTDSNIEEVIIPDSVTSIGESSFYGLYSLKNIDIPNSVANIGKCAFGYCYDLESITIPSKLIAIPDHMMEGCTNLSSVVIPDGIRTIGEWAFGDCKSITDLTLPASIISIKGLSFVRCSGLERIYFKGTAPSIYHNSFEGVTATAYYPENDSTWTESIRKNYGGTLTWVPWDPTEQPGDDNDLTIVSTTPENGDLNVDHALDYYCIQFNENIAYANAGYAYLYDTSNESKPVAKAFIGYTEDINTGSQSLITGRNTLELRFPISVELGHEYFIKIDADCIKKDTSDIVGGEEDLEEVYFKGITNDQSWRFKTCAVDYMHFNNPTDKIHESVYHVLFNPIFASWIRMIDDGTDGTCFGWAYTVGAKANGYDGINGFSDSLMNLKKDSLYEATDFSFLEYIHYAHLCQYTSEKTDEKLRKNKYDDLFNAIKASINGTGPKIIINVFGKGAHAVYPLSILEENDSEVQIQVINPNEDINTGSHFSVLTLKKENGSFNGFEMEDYNKSISYCTIDVTADWAFSAVSPYMSDNNMVHSSVSVNNSDYRELEHCGDDEVNEDGLHLYWYDGTQVNTSLGSDNQIGITDGYKDICVTASDDADISLDLDEMTSTVECLSDTPSEYEISYSEATSADDINTITVTSTTSESIVSQKTTDGLVIQSSGSEDIFVQTDELTIKASTHGDDVLITTNDDNGVEVLKDSDNDGTYDEQIEVEILNGDKKQITESMLSNIENKVYTGEEIEQDPIVMDRDKELVLNTDYSVSYENNINAGTAKVIITGIGDYTGTIECTFLIEPQSITPVISLTEYSFTYTGASINPQVTVSLNGEQLIEEVDYTLSYENNIEPGTATAIVTCIGNYSGSTTKEFTINKILTGSWKKNRTGWWYLWEDGTYPKNKFEIIKGVTYYFNPSGYMATGWQKIDGKWYYFAASGAMQTDWQKISGKWYYFNGSGVMQTGWQEISGKTYYFSAGGAMATGWQKINNKWYYFSAGGAMLTGWQKISNKWYYFDANGAMLTGWQSIGGKWYYFEGSGVMAANKWVGNYYLTASGAMATNTWIGKYYVGADGKWIPGYKAAN